jgi:hypothetical protein
MAGEVLTPTGASSSTILPISIQISLGPLTINYNGPPDFLDKLPGIIVELGKFEALSRPPQPPQAGTQ